MDRQGGEKSNNSEGKMLTW